MTDHERAHVRNVTDPDRAPEILAEVSTWTDGKVIGVAHKLAAGEYNRWFTDNYGPILGAELQRRGLDANHSWFKTVCDVCGRKALYRFRDMAFCSNHRHLAQAGRAYVTKLRDALASERAADIRSHHEERDRARAHHAATGRQRRGYRK